MDFQDLAEKALKGLPLSAKECYEVLQCPDSKILELLEASFKVRQASFGRKVRLHMLINAKSGICSEDCAYCSQSTVSEASIERYPLLDEEEIIKGAYMAKSAKAIRYCIVISGFAPTQQELDSICSAVRRIKQEVKLSICVSLGSLTESDVRKLKEAGVDRYNHNLNTSEQFYPEICTTHSYRDRIQMLRNAKKVGLELCSGVIFGMGETDDDIVGLSFALREESPHSIPVNFLHPIPGTSLERANYLSPLRCLKILCLLRFLNPRTEIRVAGGREFHIRSLQPLTLYPANSIFVSGYLTTPGQKAEEAWEMIEDMGFEIEEEVSAHLSK